MKSRIITGRDAITGKPIRITIEKDRIQAMDPGGENESAWLSPGFIDLQVNGFRGCDLNGENVDPDVVISLVERMAAVGVTTFVPTLITASEERILSALRAIAKARGISQLAAQAIPCVHLEGPFISPDDGPRGAHPQQQVRPPSIDEFERWQAASCGLVGLVTLSPHWENAREFISAIARRGVLVSIGHTHASPEQIHAAAKAGATLSTHLGNGISSMLPRHPNPIWAQLADDNLIATFIPDGHHLPADALKAMLRAKSIAQSIFVSDSVALAGMPPGIYHSAIGGEVEMHENGRLCMKGTNALAGAALPLKDGIANCVFSEICSLSDAIVMSTRNPGKLVGGRGDFRIGAKADIVRFTLNEDEKRLDIQETLLEGVTVQA